MNLARFIAPLFIFIAAASTGHADQQEQAPPESHFQSCSDLIQAEGPLPDAVVCHDLTYEEARQLGFVQ